MPRLRGYTATCTVIAAALLSGLAQLNSAAASQRSRYAGVAFLNTYRSGATNGCSTDLQPSRGMVCGSRSEQISDVDWTFLRAAPSGDVYRVTISIRAADGTLRTKATREVTFSGRRVLIWNDTFHRFTFEPRPHDR